MTFAAWLFLSISLYEFPPSFNAKPHEALGAELANQTVKQLGPAGRIFVITRETTTFANPAIEAQLKSFSRTLRQKGFLVAATNLIKVDPLRLVEVPSGEFFQMLRQASENDIIASFLGPPVLSSAQLAKLGSHRPGVVAVCSGTMPARVNLRKAFQEESLQIAIVSRRIVDSSWPAVDTPAAWFAHLYQIITPDNLTDLPASPSR